MVLKIIKNKKISYFGSEGSFTYLAALRRFGPEYIYQAEPLISQVFEDIMGNVIDIGVVPVENSTGGTVTDTIDELISDKFSQSNIQIEEELSYPIILNLISQSTELSEIKKVYSHPFPIHSYRRWIEDNLPAAKIIEISSTSAAAKMAVKKRTSAAIASVEAARAYGLNLVIKNIGGREIKIRSEEHTLNSSHTDISRMPSSA